MSNKFASGLSESSPGIIELARAMETHNQAFLDAFQLALSSCTHEPALTLADIGWCQQCGALRFKGRWEHPSRFIKIVYPEHAKQQAISYDHDALLNAQENEYLFEAIDHERKMVVTVTLDHESVINPGDTRVKCNSFYWNWRKYFDLKDLYPIEVGAEIPEGYTRETLPPAVKRK